MATIVEHQKDGAVYILLGTGFGLYKAMKPNWLFGDWVADEESGEMALVAVCDFEGRIGWFRTDDLRVISVDGRTPERLLLDAPDPEPGPEP